MFKKIAFILTCFSILHNEHAVASTAGDLNTKKNFREICGFRFASIAGMKMVTKRISPDSLHNKIDNERYNACPYKVTVTYLRVSFDLDFGNDVTLDAIKKWEGYPNVNAGVFEYGDSGWIAPSDNLTIRKSDIAVRNQRNGIVVSGIFSRKLNPEFKSDFCFGISAIGMDGYLADLECRPTKQALQPINDLFKKAAVISFQKEAPSSGKRPNSGICGRALDCAHQR